MKKYLLVIFLAVLSGSLFAIFIFRKNEDNPVFQETYKAYIFQMGVYTKEENAQILATTLDSNIIIYNEKYYVFSNLYSNEEIINMIKNYYTLNEINYYVKEVNINNEVYQKINDYETLLLKSQNIDTILKSSQDILNTYKNSLNYT